MTERGKVLSELARYFEFDEAEAFDTWKTMSNQERSEIAEELQAHLRSHDPRLRMIGRLGMMGLTKVYIAEVES